MIYSQERKTSADHVRRSDRIEVSIPVEVTGTEFYRGQSFCHKGQVLVVSRHGAAIALNYALVTDQEVTIICLDTCKEAAARVVGLIDLPERGLTYGITFLDESANPWGIEFPTLTGRDEGFGRILLTCRLCQNSSVFQLDEVELQVLETNEGIHKFCKHCSATTAWKGATNDTLRHISVPRESKVNKPVAPSVRVGNRRKHGRIETKVQACIRKLGLSEVVRCENLSRGGARLWTSRPYRKRACIEVAVPYSIGGPNIFVPAEVVHTEDCGSFFKIGVAYAKASGKQRTSVYSGVITAVEKDIS